MPVAKDVMSSPIKSLAASTEITQAVQFFIEHKITSTPVLGEDKKIIGTVSETGLVRALVLHQLQPDKFKKLQHCMDLMDQPKFVSEGDPMSKVLTSMIGAANHRVLVRSNSGADIGVISPKDLLIALNGQKSLAKDLESQAKPQSLS